MIILCKPDRYSTILHLYIIFVLRCFKGHFSPLNVSISAICFYVCFFLCWLWETEVKFGRARISPREKVWPIRNHFWNVYSESSLPWHSNRTTRMEENELPDRLCNFFFFFKQDYSLTFINSMCLTGSISPCPWPWCLSAASSMLAEGRR